MHNFFKKQCKKKNWQKNDKINPKTTIKITILKQNKKKSCPKNR